MALNQRYLQILSDRLVENLRYSNYYQSMRRSERENLDRRLQADADEGVYPLIPGVEENDLENLLDAVEEALGFELPATVIEILRQVDGFASNGVILYGVDPEFREDQFDCGPGLLNETNLMWSSLPGTAVEYLFLGDADLWYFAIELSTGDAVALERSTVQVAHRFKSVEEMVNDMLRMAVGEIEDPEATTEEPPEFQFSKN
jgi:hypothetical protein